MKGSMESLLENLKDSPNLIACSDLMAKSMEQAELEEVESLIMDNHSVVSFPDSLLFQSQDEDIEFMRPRLRAQSFNILPPRTPTPKANHTD